jgi:dTDP-4-amino-4,6-dideoxygalactose transaminase
LPVLEACSTAVQVFLGENVQALEKEFANYCGALYGIGVSDGTAALNIILREMDIGAGDEVITLSHTFIATAKAIALAGARPVFVDIEPATYLMDVAHVESRINARTKAILPVHPSISRWIWTRCLNLPPGTA